MLTTVLAQIVNPVVRGIDKANPDDSSGLFSKLIGGLVAILLVGALLWSLFQLFLGALHWINSGGDKGKLEEAQGRIRNAIIGLVLVFSVWAFYLLMLQFLGLSPTGSNGFEIKIPSLFGP